MKKLKNIIIPNQLNAFSQIHEKQESQKERYS